VAVVMEMVMMVVGMMMTFVNKQGESETNQKEEGT